MKLFLIRHGETDCNKNSVALGRTNVPLNKHGHYQVRQLASNMSHDHLDFIYSSPLKRALDTANAIANPHALTVQVEEDLIEMDIGQAEGLTYAEVRKRYPGIMTTDDPKKMVPPGSEQMSVVQERAWSVVERLHELHANRSVAIVSHNMIILSILTKVLSIEFSEFRRLRQSTTGVNIVELRNSQATILSLNDTCHLD